VTLLGVSHGQKAATTSLSFVSKLQAEALDLSLTSDYHDTWASFQAASLNSNLSATGQPGESVQSSAAGATNGVFVQTRTGGHVGCENIQNSTANRTVKRSHIGRAIYHTFEFIGNLRGSTDGPFITIEFFSEN